MGLELLSQNELMLVFSVGANYLLIFDSQKSSAAGRLVPPHGCQGSGHVAFTVRPEEISDWIEKLKQKNIEVEMEVEWSNGDRGRSIYFRDPSQNSVELAPENLWDYLRSE